MAAFAQACGGTAGAGCPSRPHSQSWELILAVTEHLFGFHVAIFSAVIKTCFSHMATAFQQNESRRQRAS